VSNQCKYPGCKRDYIGGTVLYCRFHAPAGQKHMSNEGFERAIYEQIGKKDYNFAGYIFPADISFADEEFTDFVDFKGCAFEGEVSFANAYFSGNKPQDIFNEPRVLAVSFIGAVFNGEVIGWVFF